MFSIALKKKSPADKLRTTKAILSQWIEETEAELRTPAEPGSDELWRLDDQDSITAWTAQRTLVEWLETHPEACTAMALEDQLRSRFRRIDEIHAALQALPSFHEDEGDLDYTHMDETERGQRQQVNALHDEQYTLDRECDLLARFLGISERRIHDVRHIALAYYESEETREVTQKVEAATYYPLIKEWIDGTGRLKTLPIPEHFSSWMPEYASPFPTLI
jgi:hypothetical protein